jgi:kynurenine formamidase
MPLIDLSHVVEAGMTTYPGLPGPLICDYLSRAESRAHYTAGTTFQIGKIELVANTGTYVDAPFHRYADGADLAALPLERLAHLDAVVVDARERAVDARCFEDHDVAGRAVLVRTGWWRHWRTAAYATGSPYLTAAAAELLVARGAVFVGIDALNVDDVGDGRRPAHTALLGAGIPVGEHLANLSALPPAGFRFHAVPVKVAGMGTFPVRAYAVV